MLRKIIISALFLVVGFCLNVLFVQSVWAHEIPNGQPVAAVEARTFSALESLCVDGVNSAFDNYSQHSIQIVVMNFIGNEAVSAADAVTRAWQIAAEANAFFNDAMDIHGYGGKLIFSTMPGDCNTPKIYTLDVLQGTIPLPLSSDTDIKIIENFLKSNGLWNPNRRYITVLNLKDAGATYCGIAPLFHDGRRVWNENSINIETSYFQIAPWQGTNCNEGRVLVHEFGHNVLDAVKGGHFRIGTNEYSNSQSPNPYAHYDFELQRYDLHAAESTDVMRPGGWAIPSYKFMSSEATPYKEYFGWDRYYSNLIDPTRGSYCNPNRATNSFLYKYYNACDVEGNGSPYIRIWQEKMPDGTPVVVCNEQLGAPDSRFHALKFCVHRKTGIAWLEASLRNDSSSEKVASQLTEGQYCTLPLFGTQMDGGFRLFPKNTLNGNYASGICFTKLPLSGAPSILKGEFTTNALSQYCTGNRCRLDVELDISTLMTDTVPVLRAENLILSVAAPAEAVEGSAIPLTMTLNTASHFPVRVNLSLDGNSQDYYFPYGTAQVVAMMNVTNDDQAQPDRIAQYQVTIISGMPTGQAKQGTILIHDNDARQLSISTTITRVVEGASLPVVVRLSQGANHEVSGSIGIAGAIHGEQSFVLASGQQALTITQTISDNGVDDPDSVLAIALQNVVANPQDMVITTTTSLSVSVIDALDSRPTLSLAAPYSSTEGATGSITVTLSAPALHPVIAKIKTNGLISAPVTVTIPTGEMMAYVAVTANQTPGWQGDRIASIEFEEVQNAEIVQGKQTMIVADSEPRPDMIFLPVVRR